MRNTPQPENDFGAMTTNERVEQLMNHVGTMRSELHSICRQVDLVKAIERTILGFMAIGLVTAIVACIYFAQT